MEARDEKSTPTWERQDKEPLKHFSWFHAFLMLGPGRSLLGAYNAFRGESAERSQRVFHPAVSVSKAWRDACEKWHWRERAAARDLWQQQQAQQHAEESQRNRQRELEDKLFRVRERLVEKVEKMLDFPLHRVTSGGNGGTTIIEPVRWNLNSVARLLDAQSKLGGESDIQKYIDLTALNEEQLHRLSKGENIYKVLGLAQDATNSHDDIADSGAGGN